MPSDIDSQALIRELQKPQPDLELMAQIIGHATILDLGTKTPFWISPAGFKALIDVLKQNKTVSALDLSNCCVGDEWDLSADFTAVKLRNRGAYNSVMLADLLSSNKTIGVLKLNGFDLIDYSTDRFPGHLEQHADSIDEIIAIYPRNTEQHSVQEDVLSIYTYKKDDFADISPEVQSALYTFREKHGLAAFFKSLAVFSHVKQLELCDCNINRYDLENVFKFYLSEKSTLNSLNVANNNLKFCIVHRILEGNKISFLNLANNGFLEYSSLLIPELVTPKPLTLHLEGNPVGNTPVFIQKLQDDKNIVTLCINYSSIPAESWPGILIGNKSLVSIEFYNDSQLSYDEFLQSPVYREIIDILDLNTTLLGLSFDGRPVLQRQKSSNTASDPKSPKAASVAALIMTQGNPVFTPIPDTVPKAAKSQSDVEEAKPLEIHIVKPPAPTYS